MVGDRAPHPEVPPNGSLSAYDDTMPHPTPDDAIAGKFAAIRQQRPATDLEAVRDVVAVVSSSRAGSTMLGELLRGSADLLAFPAEMNPYVVVAQLAGNSRGVLVEELRREIGQPAVDVDVELEEFAHAVHWRLLAQWPRVDVSADDVVSAVARASRAIGPCASGFTARLLAELIDRGVPLRLDQYDGVDAPPTGTGPPVEPVIEMAPYVEFRPWRLATERDAASKPLVIATPRNAYRLDLLASLFANARLRVLHLTRNPTASVNGLIDGWLHAGFHSTRVPRPLHIAGYSGAVPGGEQWWKFDVPPQWQTVRDATLAEVCALQWWSPHEHVLAHVKRSGVDYLQVRYEDLVGPATARRETAAELAAWLGVPAHPFVESVVRGLAPKMATAPPRPRRWERAGNDLAPALAQPKVRDVTARLGYDWDEQLWI
jgi:hypothetical protein